MIYQVISRHDMTVGVWALPPTLTITAMPLGGGSCHLSVSGATQNQGRVLMVSCMVGVDPSEPLPSLCCCPKVLSRGQWGQPGCSRLWGPVVVGHTGWVGGVQVDSSEASFSASTHKWRTLVPLLPLRN